jgi:hypothetical protein
MFKKSKDNEESYKFKTGNKTIEVYFSDDGSSELYDEEDPLHTGFVFSDDKQLISFVNNLTDIVENHLGD